MGTRSRIAVMHGTVCKSVYCHWDGYLAHNGRILSEYYDSAKANELISIGNLSSLAPDIGVKHDFEQKVETCNFYSRDRGDTDQDFQTFTSLPEFAKHFDNMGCEVMYLMRLGVWHVVEWTYNGAGDLVMIDLNSVLKKEVV